MSDLTFYWGAASGSARAALRQLEEPNVAINYATKLNQPWDGIDRLFIDSGGYSFMLGMGEYGTTDSEYLDYIEKHEPERFALRDYPCEPDIREEYGRTVEEHQRLTTERHITLLDELEDRRIDAQPLAVLQGWTPRDYLDHIDELSDHGCLIDEVAVGTLCGRESAAKVRHILRYIHKELGYDYHIHAFGVKLDVFREPFTLARVDSADSNAYDFDERKDRTRGGDTRGRTWQDVAFYYLKHKRKMRQRIGGDGEPDPSWLRDQGQRGLDEIPATDGGFTPVADGRGDSE